MNDKSPYCPECEHGPDAMFLPGRRDFFRTLGATAAAVAVGGMTPLARARAARAEKQAAAEALVFDLYKTMDADQKAKLVLPWDHGPKNGIPARLAMSNAPIGNSKIGTAYTKKQAEILDRLFRAIGNGEEGYKQLSRGGDFDSAGSFDGVGALIYGEPAEGKKFSLVFSAHHLTIRCDGNSEEGAAFGGPLYYGHSPNGYSTKNVFNYQTRAVKEVFGALDEKQRKEAVLKGTPGELAPSIKFRKPTDAMPGLAVRGMSKDQKALVEKVMRDLISPYRKEDGDEVMEVVKANGGMDKISLAFYLDKDEVPEEPWHFWRLEGPGFVWNFRVLPHVHTYVNVSSKIPTTA
jgi:hypothetical protein